MTPEQAKFIVDEIERRWRARTPARTIADALPQDRVNRSEINAFMVSLGMIPPIRDDEFDRAVFKLFDRLRKEFPEERWEPRRNSTAGTKARRKELGLR